MEHLNVLLVEDNDEHAHIISRHLTRWEAGEVRVTREGLLKPALTRLGVETYDVILLDLRLPDSDFHKTLPQIVQKSKDIPIVILSSLEDRQIALETVHKGAQDYLVKSDFTPGILLRAIYNSIERKRIEITLKHQMEQIWLLYRISNQALEDSDIENFMRSLSAEICQVMGLDYAECIVFRDNKIDQLQLSDEILQSSGPVYVKNFQKSSLIGNKAVFSKVDICSGLNFLIRTQDQKPGGLLMAYSKSLYHFTGQEKNFFMAIGNLLASICIRKDLEESLHQKVRDLREANIRKDEFLATLSHELRTPLNVIKGGMGLLRSEPIVSKSFEETIELIERNIDFEIDLVNEILELSRAITGKIKISPEKTYLPSLVADCLEAVRAAATARGISTSVEIEKEVDLIYVDEPRFRQILWNLLSNAVKFNYRNGTVALRAYKKDDSLIVSVKSTGVGIDQNNLANVFQRFWQEDSGKDRKYMGLGIGLATVRHLVELHGGKVEAKSRGRGKGAEFIVSLPNALVGLNRVQGTESMTSDNKAVKQLGGERKSRLAGVRILLVDDSEDTLLLMERLLSKWGAVVDKRASAKEGLEAATTLHYDLIISDIGMPEMDGYEMMKELRLWEARNGRNHLPAIALTAYVSEEDIQKAREAGFERHLAKPAKLTELQQTILDLREARA